MTKECTNENLVKLRKEIERAKTFERRRELKGEVAAMCQKMCENIVNTEFSSYANDRDDLILEGMLEASECLEEWNSEKSKPLTFLNRRIRWRMKIYTYKNIGNPTSLNKNLINKASNWEAYIDAARDSGKTRDELIEELSIANNVPVDKIKEKLSFFDTRNKITYYHELSETEVPSTSSVEENIEREEFFSELSRIIWRYCDNDMEFELIRMKYDPFDEGFKMTIAQMASLLGITSGMISKKLDKIQNKIDSDPDQKLKKFLIDAVNNNL